MIASIHEVKFLAYWQGKVWAVTGFMKTEGKVMLKEIQNLDSGGTLNPWIEDVLIFKRLRKGN